MKKTLCILENIIIVLLIIISCLLFVKFIYKITHEKIDTSYLWDVNYYNLTIKEGSKTGKFEKQENGTIKFSTTLKKEGEFCEFTVDIKNNGNLDAKISKINKEITSINNILTADITYDNGQKIKENDIIKSKETKKIKIHIAYPKQNQKIYEALELNLKLSIKFVPNY